MKNRLLTFFTTALLCASAATAVDYVPKYEVIDKPEYPTTDYGVATFNVLDYGADPTGNTDCTQLFQTLLDKLAEADIYNKDSGDKMALRKTGGTLYIPEGRYRIDGQLLLHRGLTIRGDWKKPEKGQPIKGTILMAYYGKNVDVNDSIVSERKAFITMEPCTQVSHLAVWYPEQNATNPVSYPPTFLYGRPGYWGNEHCMVRNVTMVNSYIGIRFSATNGGGCPNVFGVYGTPLYIGIKMDNIADVGRLDGISFSPGYWKGSGLEGAGDASAWMYENGRGMHMNRIDWSYTCNADIEGYKYGFYTGMMFRNDKGELNSSDPNGEQYNMNISNCYYGIYMENTASVGLLFSRVNTQHCWIGIGASERANGVATFYGCNIHGAGAAVRTPEKSGEKMQFHDCVFDGKIQHEGGQFLAVGCKYNNDDSYGPMTRFTRLYPQRGGNNSLTDNSLFQGATTGNPNAGHRAEMPEVPARAMAIPVTKPAKPTLFVMDQNVTTRINEDIKSKPDQTQTIQNLLNQAKANGGGIVYLPSGHYRCDGTLTIPAGVELKGSSDLPSMPHGEGAVLEVYAGKGNENGTPFITMEAGSGLRAITVNYPEQTSASNPLKYPYAIRANKDVYIVNVRMRATYQGIDLFTNKCDNHYVDFIGGHVFVNAFKVGNNSTNGIISNYQFNTIAYACGDEWKFGSWPNSDKNIMGKPYEQNNEQLDFIKLGDTDGQILYNNFNYGGNIGIHLINEGNGGPKNGMAIGCAVDGSLIDIQADNLANDFVMINSQLVALNLSNLKGSTMSAAFFEAHSDPAYEGKVIMYNCNGWGGGDNLFRMEGGEFNLNLGYFSESGSKNTFNTTAQSYLTLNNCVLNNSRKTFVNANAAKNTVANNSVVTINASGSTKFKSSPNLLPVGWELKSAINGMISRTGWKATAHNDPSGTDKAPRAIDGDSDTRWDSGDFQSGGEWFQVNMGKTNTLNCLILDVSNSSNDGPAEYTVTVDGRQVATGSNGGSQLLIRFNTTSGNVIRVNQSGTKPSAYWSIQEFYALNLPDSASGIEDIINDGDNETAYSLQVKNGSIELGEGFAQGCQISVYSVNGSMNFTRATSEGENIIELPQLDNGIYIIIAKRGNHEAFVKTVF